MSGRSGGDAEEPDGIGAPRRPLRFLIGIGDVATVPDLVAYVGTVGANGRGIARVVHVVERVGHPGGLSRESVEQAADLVDEASFLLRMSGVGADGIVRHGKASRVEQVLLEEAEKWHADAIVLLARRGGAWRRFLVPGVRERLLRQSRITTVLVSRQTYLARGRGTERESRSRG